MEETKIGLAKDNLQSYQQRQLVAAEAETRWRQDVVVVETRWRPDVVLVDSRWRPAVVVVETKWRTAVAVQTKWQLVVAVQTKWPLVKETKWLPDYLDSRWTPVYYLELGPRLEIGQHLQL